MLSLAEAEFYPHRIYKERKKSSLNYGWKFYLGDASGNPYEVGYDDAGWKTVNIPHSATYDPPTPEGERAAHQGICWYRKRFTVPASKHSGKIFIEFEGAMQTADVWLNGKKLGTHDNSGYTWFSFDITDNVSLTETNLLAVRLDNRFSAAIPPGCAGASMDRYPDYYLYSGIYRDVWLVSVDKCYIPLYGQRISVPRSTASEDGAKVQISTTVCNEYTEAKNVELGLIITDSSNTTLFGHTMQASVEAGKSYLFDATVGPIEKPKLWSPENPYLYKVFTRVFIDGEVVDDYVDRFGVRWYDWTPDSGFSLNNKPTIIKGACLHQSLGWIENALPTSRFFKEVELVKNMGANLIRGAHFPRDPSFYNACDEIGMMAMVEIPTWGTTSPSYPDSFWIRQKNVVKEMIEVGYNHPSIIIWGLFNEPMNDFSEPHQIPLLNETAHALDPTRLTYMANNDKESQRVFLVDIVGINYGVDLMGPISGRKARTINTEYHEGWLYWCFRGGENDNTAEGNYATERWRRWLEIENYRGTNRLAGGCMWSFNDYWSPFMDHPMGVVDHYRIPKAVFYYFREKWRGVKGDYPVAGSTPTQLVLTSDLDSLIADSTDVVIVTAAFRDAAGNCVFIGRVDKNEQIVESTPVTFSVSGPADYFGSLTVKAVAGKAPLMIKSKNTAGTITISASAGNLTSNTVTIRAVHADTSELPFISGITRPILKNNAYKYHVIKRAGIVFVKFPHEISRENIAVSVYNMKGQKLFCPFTVTKESCIIDLQRFGNGLYIVSVGDSGKDINIKNKILITKR